MTKLRSPRVWKNLFGLAAAAVCTLQAGPLMPPLVVPPVVAGETTLCRDGGGCIPGPFWRVRVDWIVDYIPAQQMYNYYYQVESPNDLFFLDFQVLLPGTTFLSVGQILNTNLDGDFIGISGESVLGHNSLNYANLGAVPAPAENEEVGGMINASNAFLNPGAAEWTWTADAQGIVFAASTVLWGRSPLAPVYGGATGMGAPPVITWSTAESGDRLPIPGGANTPEPATWMAGVCLLGILCARRRSRQFLSTPVRNYGDELVG